MKILFFVALIFTLTACSQNQPEPIPEPKMEQIDTQHKAVYDEEHKSESKSEPKPEHKPESGHEPEPILEHEPVVTLLIEKNHVEIASHLNDVIFNARFLEIQTYEGSGQTVHPHVLFFDEKFMGFHYIMAITPYPYSNNAHENPSIFGSHDGVIWEVPDGVINPVVGIPIDIAYGGYYSDPFILRKDNILELWFRHTLGRSPEGQSIRRNSHNRIYRTVSTDLKNWSPLDIMLDCPDNLDAFMSPTVIHNGSKYRIWYANFNSQLFYIESDDFVSWSERVRVYADLGGLGIWHHEIRHTGEQYEALFTSADWGNNPQFRLFFAISDCGLDFGIGSEISVRCLSPALVEYTVHKCSFVKINGVYQMYFTVTCPRRTWRLFYFEIAEENLYRLFGS